MDSQQFHDLTMRKLPKPGESSKVRLEALANQKEASLARPLQPIEFGKTESEIRAALGITDEQSATMLERLGF